MTLVISLRDSTFRRNKVAEGLQAAGVSYRIVNAVLGSSLSESHLKEIAPVRFMPRFGRDLGPGEIGCSLSHKLALEDFLSTEDNIALILEDDAVVPCNVIEAIGALVARLPEGWGLLKIGGIGGVRGRLVCETSYGKIIDTPATTVCSHAYVTSRTGASLLLRAMLPVRFPYDIYLRDVFRHRAKTYEVVPTLIEQTDLAGSRISVERADSIQAFQIRRALAYPAWKLRHEISRRGHLLTAYGLRAALAPSKLKRHF
jgi:glycosyl transferase family 25